MGHRHRRREKQSLFAELLVVHNLVKAEEEKATISTAQRSSALSRALCFLLLTPL